MSKKYQVLSDETAFVGVIKQKDMSSGEVKEYKIEYGVSVTSQQAAFA